MKIVARARALDRRYFGVVEGLVTENASDPAKEGRVKVRFPWFDDETITEWCRVAQIYAGNQYGGFWIPEVGDEVVVSFVHGDMRFPIVLGGLYNGQDKPTTSRESDKDQKLLRTKGGHEVLLDDTSGDKRIQVKTDGGHVLDMSDKDKKVTLRTSDSHKVELDDQGQKVTVTTSGGNKVELNDMGNKITVQTAGGAVVTLDGSANSVTITGPTTITVQGTTINLEGTTINLGSGASHGLIFGDMFMALFNAHTHNCTAVGAPTGPPLAPLQPAMISQISKTM